MAKSKITKDDMNKAVPGGIDFDAAPGETLPAQSEILQLEIGDVRAFRIVGRTDGVMLTPTSTHTVTLWQGEDDDGKSWRLPVSAIFLTAMDRLKVGIGDSILIRRDADAVKQKGLGKGNRMLAFSVKVTARAGAGA